MLWNVGEKVIQTLYCKGMIEGIYKCILDFDFYEHCIYGKHNWVWFAYGATSIKGILDSIHNDVFVPMPIHH